jgi:hypothetical protein
MDAFLLREVRMAILKYGNACRDSALCEEGHEVREAKALQDLLYVIDIVDTASNTGNVEETLS